MMNNIEGTNIQAQGRTSRSRRRLISLVIAGVAVLLVAGTVVIGTQSNASRSGSLLSADCNGVNFMIKGKGTWIDFSEKNLATEEQIAALNQCQKFSKWALDNGEYEVLTTWINSFFWTPGKNACKVSYYSMGSNYKGTYCDYGRGDGADLKYAIVLE